MSKVADVLKRVVLGRALRSTQAHYQLLPKRIALPVFASDALSSVAYAPQEILITLGIAGLAGYAFTPWIGLAVVLLLLVVVASYRQNVRAYTSGGGDFDVATANLGANWGLVVAAALLVDYVLTVAVSISAAVDNLGAFTPLIGEHRVFAAVALVALLTVLNLRGVKESGFAFAVPTYLFVFGVFTMMVWGFFRLANGSELQAETARLEVHGTGESLAGLAMVFLLLRAFASGCAALTGVEAISNGVPAFRKPKGKNAATTLLMLGLLAVTMFFGVTMLAHLTDVKYADPLHGSRLVDPETGQDVSTGQHTVMSQVAEAVFSNFPAMYVFVTVMTALILVMAANTAYNGFPVLASVLAQNRYLPRQLHTRGDRLAFSNGIVMLAGAAALLIYVFKADVTRLIQLYIVGVFVSFTVSQTGMVRHWNRLLRTTTERAAKRQMRTSRLINTVGLVITGAVLVIVVVTKFTHGAWIVCIAMPVLFLLMRGIRGHYDRVARELEPDDDTPYTLPSRTHAIVLVSKIHKPTLRALAYARATRPSTLEAVSVAVDTAESERLRDEWDALDLPVPLKILDSPYREITRPILEYVKNVRRKSPRDVVAVYIPEYVVGHWWEHVLHNHSALRLKGRLLFQPGVMVTSVPWQLASSDRLKARPDRPAPGSVRRGDGERRTRIAERD
ncbi:APC family permease [Actinocorallia sp. API 0066]|uniref:APC family permease n=1 Tax=Actinocorallia sp. API 0066 TaxID=2896846 RepID=UPI001E2F882B|nr:APC family permease [Actinocorallia sp. API 0066]MCD0451986.1 APC family permease [Actinocorallia sp. API 0066]